MHLTSSQLKVLNEAGMSRRNFLKLLGRAAGAAVGAQASGPIEVGAKAVEKLASLAAPKVLPKFRWDTKMDLLETLFMFIGERKNANTFSIYKDPNLLTLRGDHGEVEKGSYVDLFRKHLPKASKPEHLKAIQDYNAKIDRDKMEFVKKHTKDYGEKGALEQAQAIFGSHVTEAYEATPEFLKQVLDQMSLEDTIGWFFTGKNHGKEAREWLGKAFDQTIQRHIAERGVKEFVGNIFDNNFWEWGKDGLEEALDLVPEVSQFLGQFGVSSAQDLQNLTKTPKEFDNFLMRLHKNGVLDTHQVHQIDPDYSYRQEFEKKRREVEQEKQQKEQLAQAKSLGYAGREFGREREHAFDPEGSRPAQALGPFESRLNNKLETFLG
jgi:hypothetical protein